MRHEISAEHVVISVVAIALLAAVPVLWGYALLIDEVERRKLRRKNERRHQ
jgi:hypothetical protein